MDQQEFMPRSQSSESLQGSSEAQSQDRQTLSDNEVDTQSYNQSQQPEAGDMPESNLPFSFENSPLPDSFPIQDQTTFVQQPNNEQNTQEQQYVDLLPGLGSIVDKEISIGQSKQSMEEEQNSDTSTVDSTSRDAYGCYSQSNVQKQGWRWAWSQGKEKTRNISLWIGLLLLLLAILVSIPLLYSVDTILVRVLVVISLLPLIFILGMIVVLLIIPLFRLLRLGNHRNK